MVMRKSAWIRFRIERSSVNASTKSEMKWNGIAWNGTEKKGGKAKEPSLSIDGKEKKKGIFHALLKKRLNLDMYMYKMCTHSAHTQYIH